MDVPTQKRTPSRCREWERVRRNKFNDAITKLGEVAKAVNRSNFPEADVADVQCPKVEVIQRAITCLTKCAEQIIQLKAEILAVQVQLETSKTKSTSVKEASTQVYFGLSKKRKDGKYVKLLMLKNGKDKTRKNITQDNNNKPQAEVTKKLPKLLPRGINLEKKENTFVVLPASPYIFPPRSLLFPTVPPAIVLVDQNLQPLNKGPVPIVNRNNGEITKTTMVNILPISAYSHPLSAVKNKKQNTKLKPNASKKANKKLKHLENPAKTSSKVVEVTKKVATDSFVCKENILEVANKENNSIKAVSEVVHTVESDKLSTSDPSKSTEETVDDIKAISNISNANVQNNKESEVANADSKGPKDPESVVNKLPTTTSNVKLIDVKCLSINKNTKSQTSKENVPDIKEKENKLSTVMPLDTPLCDNVVDGGNARLELAEEFLATSPTAAFLMSFPLVSGNRADSPAEEHNTIHSNTKESTKNTDLVPLNIGYFEKSNNNVKTKTEAKLSNSCNTSSKQSVLNIVVPKETSNATKVSKLSNTIPLPNISENPFLNLSMPSLISTTCTLNDTNFGSEFDCGISKSVPNQSTSYVSSNNLFYKNDPFSAVKNTIYSTSSITPSHDFNSIGLYPCAMEKYTSKSKPEYSCVDENLMKIGSSRLTYDIDLGWSQKGLDFVNCTTSSNMLHKDTILTSTSVPYTTSYNPFNPDFHVPLVPTSTKKDNNHKVPGSSFAETITSFYSQPTNLWTDDVPFYTNNNIPKSLTAKSQNYPMLEHGHNNPSMKLNVNKHYETKMSDSGTQNYPILEHGHNNPSMKLNVNKHYETKMSDSGSQNYPILEHGHNNPSMKLNVNKHYETKMSGPSSQNYPILEHGHNNPSMKLNVNKHYETKMSDSGSQNYPILEHGHNNPSMKLNDNKHYETKMSGTGSQNYPILEHGHNNPSMKLNVNKHYETKMSDPSSQNYNILEHGRNNPSMKLNDDSSSQNYPMLEHAHNNPSMKLNANKQYKTNTSESSIDPGVKDSNNIGSQSNSEKYTKKSPSKMHINWMTSEIGSQTNCNPIHPPHSEMKETSKSFNHMDLSVKKQNSNEGNYFPISMHNFPAQPAQDEFQAWPSSTRPLGTTEISIDPPPINLPTLVGDLALGPHEKNKKTDSTVRTAPHSEIQNCGNFLSVTQLMNRSSDYMQSRFQAANIEALKSIPTKQHINHFSNDAHRKTMTHLENQMSQPCYVFNDPKSNSYDNMTQFTPTKTKSNAKTEKSSKTQKNNYSTEALLRGANCTQKIQDSNTAKFIMQSQKYPDYSTGQDTAVAQVSHFPPIIDYSDNGYSSQQFSAPTLFNTATNPPTNISNSFYSNFMSGGTNLMSSNYASTPFTGDFIDYNQSAECNYANHKYEELKMRNNTAMFQTDKVTANYKSSKRDATKHKLECSKKESNKKYHSKKAKINSEVSEDWNDPSHLIWQNKTTNKKPSNLMAEEMPFANYMGNQIPTQYQSEFFNSHLMPTNVQSMGHNVDRSLAGFPVTSRANFNLSTIFPEITMKVQ